MDTILGATLAFRKSEAQTSPCVSWDSYFYTTSQPHGELRREETASRLCQSHRKSSTFLSCQNNGARALTCRESRRWATRLMELSVSSLTYSAFLYPWQSECGPDIYEREQEVVVYPSTDPTLQSVGRWSVMSNGSERKKCKWALLPDIRII